MRRLWASVPEGAAKFIATTQTRERANARTRERANARTRERENARTRERENARTRERANGSVAATGAAAAAAAALGHIIRVGHGEAAAHQPVNVVHLGAFDVLGAHRIDQDAHAVELGDTVVLAWLVVQGHAIGRAGAA